MKENPLPSFHHRTSAGTGGKPSACQRIQEFAIKGNVIDLAVGVIIGGASGKIVDSVVDDLIMLVVGKLVGNMDFSNLFIVLATCPGHRADAGRKSRRPGVSPTATLYHGGAELS